MIQPYNNIEDMLNKPCENICGGVYRESSISDSLDEIIYCIICNERINRYRINTEAKEE